MDAVKRIYNYFYDDSLSQTTLNSKLLEAAKAGNLNEVITLLENNAQIDTTDQQGKTPLMWACENGHKGVVIHLLVDHHVNIELKDTSGKTALIWACIRGHNDVVALLLEKGADIHVIDKFGKNALMITCWYDRTSTAALLLEKGADIHATNNWGHNALKLADMKKKTGITYLLLSYMKPAEREAFANEKNHNFLLVENFKNDIKEKALMVYDKMRRERWEYDSNSIFSILPSEVISYIRSFEAPLEIQEKFKQSWYRFRAFEHMNLAIKCCTPFVAEKPLFPVLFLSNRRKVEDDLFDESNRPNKKICLAAEASMDVEPERNKL